MAEAVHSPGLAWGTTALSAAGLALSGYLTAEHFSASTTLACPANAIVDCAKVTSSEYSSLGGIPVVLLGLTFFAAMTALCVPRAWRASSSALHRARVGTALGGVLFVLYLIWAELFRIGAICLWCTVVHAVTIALFAAVALAAAFAEPAALEPVPEGATRR